MFKLVQFNDSNFVVEGEKEILNYLGYGENIDMIEASAMLDEEESCYRIIECYDYVIIDNDGSYIDATGCDSEEEALEKADLIWSKLSDYDKKHREGFFVIKSANPNVDAEDHLDGDIIKDYFKWYSIFRKSNPDFELNFNTLNKAEAEWQELDLHSDVDDDYEVWEIIRGKAVKEILF